MILRHADNLSKTLQSSTISAPEGQRVAQLTVTVLENMRTSEAFSLLWESFKRKSSVLEIEEPSLPRRRRAPRRYEIGDGEP